MRLRTARTMLALIVSGVLSGAVSAQDRATSWAAWARAHAFPIASVVPAANGRDDFSDLQFLKNVIGERRLVQLGESGHGVAEFDSAKARLVKFFHEEMGFDVIAFESSMYECFAANATIGQPGVSGPSVLANSIFGVWWTSETLPLFNYLVASHDTDRPLILAGFDSQWSSPRMLPKRPDFLKRIVSAFDKDYAEDVYWLDFLFITSASTGGTTAYAKKHEVELVDGYARLERVLHEHRAALADAFPGDASPIIAERTARSMVAFVRQLVAFSDRPNDTSETGGGPIRDTAMADNLAFLMRELYRGKKILVWAHNYHIRHANPATSSFAVTMGSFTAKAFRDDLYTIGLYMNRGLAAFNDRTVYAINPAPSGSMEAALFAAGPSASFVDFLHQTPEEGNEWIFEAVYTREWGLYPLFMVPRDQYDGVLFIDQVTAPRYQTF